MRQMLKYMMLFICFTVAVISCTKNQKLHEKIKTGMTKSEIVQIMGETSEKRFITKRNNKIQGPEEDFWYEIELGTKLEAWTYTSEEGTLNLYFVGNGKELKYKIFTPVRKK